MSDNSVRPADDGALRRGEERATALSPADEGDRAPGCGALHELRVHQIELELQNEELRRAHEELAASRARYVALNDLAPVGYVTVTGKGLILEANRTAAALLGAAREEFVGRHLSRFIPLEEDSDSFHLLCMRLLETGKEQACDLRMAKSDGTPLWARLVATAGNGPDGAAACFIALSDITVRKRGEASLRESEQRQLSLFNSMAEAFALHDLLFDGQGRPCDYRFLSVNPAFERLTGLKGIDLVGKSQRLLFPGEDPFWFETYSKVALTGEPAIFEHYSPVLERHYSVCAYCPAPNQFATVFTDITARKKDEACREMGQSVLQILNGPGDLNEAIRRALGVFKSQTGADAVGLRLQAGDDYPYFVQAGFSDDFLLTENGLAERGADGGVCRDKDGNVILECTCGVVISGKADPAHPLFTRGGSFWTNDSAPLLDLPADQDPRHHPRNVCIHQGYASVALIPVRDKARIVGIIHLNARRKGFFTLAMVNILEDIAAHIGEALTRKQAEEALRASRQLLDGIINAIPVSVFWKDRNLVYLGCNAPFARDAGFTDPKEIVGKDDYQMGWRAQADLYRRDDRAVIESGRAKLNIEEPLTAPDGQTLTILTSKIPLRNSHGEIGGILGVYHDITKHKRDEAELQKMQNLQSVGTLAGGIAHDFNNILLGLFGNISLAMEELPKEHPSYAPLEEADKSMGRAVRLTKQLLTFAKGGRPVKEHVSLADMVVEVARFDLTGSSVSLVFHPAEDLWPVDADRGQLQQVVSNLVINARQAMPKGGRLTVTLENAELPEDCVPTLGQGRYVRIVVQDEGDGIDPKVIDHIFDPYFTTKPTGSGLGLATVWSIINKHGGHIGVVSELGKGAAFTFYLPAAASPRPDEAKPPAADCPPPASHAKILIMDDDESISRLAARMLMPCGYTVATAPGGQEAIALYRQALETEAPFDAVIMDLTIPGGPGGKEVIKDLLALDPHVRAIVSSGYAGDPVMANPSAYGFKGAAAKPYTARALREAVARVLK